MLAAMSWFACREFGWNLNYVLWEIPASFILLMSYQKLYETNDGVMNLQDKEQIDALIFS